MTFTAELRRISRERSASERMGVRTILATPLLREGTPLG